MYEQQQKWERKQEYWENKKKNPKENQNWKGTTRANLNLDKERKLRIQERGLYNKCDAEREAEILKKNNESGYASLMRLRQYTFEITMGSHILILG